MLDGFGIATLEVENDDNEDETQTFEEFMVFDSSVQNVQQIVNQSSSLLLYPSQISQNFLSTDSIRIANTVYRRPNLFSSRYYDNINNEFSKYQRRIKRRLVPNTRVISSTLYRNGNEVLTWNRSRGSGNENSTFQQWYLPLQVSIWFPHIQNPQIMCDRVDQIWLWTCWPNLIAEQIRWKCSVCPWRQHLHIILLQIYQLVVCLWFSSAADISYWDEGVLSFLCNILQYLYRQR